jgi:DNA polymerase
MRTYDIINAGPRNRFMADGRIVSNSGKAVQLHNMARPIKTVEELEDINAARELIYAKDFSGIVKRFEERQKDETIKSGSVIDVVTSCIRSSFVAPTGKKLVVSDLNAIENRVLGWVAGEDKILEVFRLGRDPYLAFASLMYKIPYEVLAATKKTPDTKEKRQIAKPAVLGAGYRLAGGKWGINPKTKDRIKTGLWGYAEAMGVLISQDLAVASVKAFRAEYKKVVGLWYDSERAVAKCIRDGGQQPIGPTGLVWCDRKKRKDGSLILRIHLPSGRYLHYLNAGLDTTVMQGDNGPYERENFVYDGIDQVTRMWGVVRSHGGKIVENVVQAISRDVLAEAMLEADEVGFEIIGHVHDEIVTLSDDTEDSLGLVDLKCIMSTTPSWAPGLPLNAEGYEGYFYRKG